jgi:hypothetical protein
MSKSKSTKSIGIPSTTLSKLSFRAGWCNPVSKRVMDIFHMISLLAVLVTAIWNVYLTVEGTATVSAMRPIFITTLVSAIIKVPSQICAAHDTGGWLTVAGSVVTIVITAILVGYLTWDPVYRNDGLESVCISAYDKTTHTTKRWNAQLETNKINSKATDTSVCDETCTSNNLDSVLAAPQAGGAISSKQLYRASFNPALWSPVFHA